jgi:hypothetical protein
MIDFLRSLRALVLAVHRFRSRRAAQELIAARLPRGLLDVPRMQLLSLRVPPEPATDGARAADEFRALPLGAQVIRGQAPGLLFRLAALPPAPLELGIARPRNFRLDAELRLPIENNPIPIAFDAPPPARPRRVRPRTPLARAPLSHLRPRSLRLDPRTLASANEGILPLHRRELVWGWVRPDFRREIVDVQWMAAGRISFLDPQPVEWFTIWWFENDRRRPGGREATFYELPRELGWALDECKEQMLIRRDVKKDETELEPARFKLEEVGVSMAEVEQVPLTALIPDKPWIEPAGMLDPLPFDARAREAYLQWRTLLSSLEER